MFDVVEQSRDAVSLGLLWEGESPAVAEAWW